jgi:hypothetical protein
MVQDNDLYDTDVNLIFYDEPIFHRYETRLQDIFSQARYTDLRANLAYFASLYRDIAATNRRSSPNRADSAPFAAFETVYTRYIDQEAALVKRDISILDKQPTLAGAFR